MTTRMLRVGLDAHADLTLAATVRIPADPVEGGATIIVRVAQQDFVRTDVLVVNSGSGDLARKRIG